jgi:hypothetical protein
VGASTTAIVAGVILITKFDRGAWIIVMLIPLIVLLFREVSAHYSHVRRHIETLSVPAQMHLRHLAIVPMAHLNNLALHSLAYARSITPDVITLHVAMDLDDETQSRAAWATWATWLTSEREDWERHHRPHSPHCPHSPPHEHEVGRQRRTPSPPSSLTAGRRGHVWSFWSRRIAPLIPPILAYVDAVRDADPGMTITVILPEFVPAHWWEYLLHNRTALHLKLSLYSHHGIVVANVSYHLRP